jgi:hypothetical protein
MIKIKFTDHVVVVIVYCAIQSSDLLHCNTHFQDGKLSHPYALTRFGPGPKNLTSVLR